MAHQHYGARDDSGEAGVRLAYFILGGTMGALIALLFAPKSGYELRGDIADVTRRGVDRSRETATQLGTKANEYYGATKERASGLYESATQRAGEVAGTARDVAARKGEQLSAAIEAGKQAYAEEKRRGEPSGMGEGRPQAGQG